MHADEIQRALRHHDNNVRAAARALGVTYNRLRLNMMRLGLWSEHLAAAQERRHRERDEILQALERNQGVVARAARDLGIPLSRLDGRIRGHRLQAELRALRPVKPPAREEKARIREALARHQGQVARAAAELGLNRTTLRDRVAKYQLVAEARAMRQKASLGGRLLAREQVLSVLRRCDGKIAPASRELGVKYHRFQDELHRLGLDPEIVRLRRERRERDRRRIMAALEHHRGSARQAARDFGVAASSLRTRLRTLDLVSHWRLIRFRPYEAKTFLREAIRRNQGQMTKICAELGISKNTLTSWVRKHNLLGEADALRAEANLIGPRAQLPLGRNLRERRAKLRGLLESCGWNVTRAIAKSGVATATFYKNMRDLGVKRPKQQQSRLQRMVDALRLHRGVVWLAAKRMKVSAAQFLDWCSRYDLEPRDFRR